MFITLEGVDGSGKSTQAGLLAERLKKRFPRRSVLRTREPGGWEGGGWIRERILEGEYLHPMSELLLFLVDRCEHVRRQILPVLDAGGIVICERYSDSTMAYQSWGRGIPAERVSLLIDWCGLPSPDVTFWLDLPVRTALERLGGRGDADRFESEGEPFLERVRAGFASMADENPGRFIRSDATASPEDLSSSLFTLLEESGYL